MDILAEPKPDGGGGRGPLVAVALLLAVGAVVVAAWLLLKRPPPAPPAAPTPAANARSAPTPKPTPTPAPVPGATTGTLEVETTGADASVAVDGEPRGNAPQRLELPPGPHLVRVTRPGFEAWEREVHVVPGRTARVKARLESEASVLRIDADVPGANVFLDRKFLGTTPVEARDVAPGPHRLNVSAEGYEPYAESLEVEAGRHELVVRFKEVRLDEKLPVVHKHGIGSCNGLLVATTAGLRYEGSEKADAFGAPFSALEPLQVDYLKKNLRVKLKGGKTYNFTGDSADALLSFQKAVEAARKRL